MKNITRLKLWLAITAIFALGCATGVFLDRAYRLRADWRMASKRGRASDRRARYSLRVSSSILCTSAA